MGGDVESEKRDQGVEGSSGPVVEWPDAGGRDSVERLVRYEDLADCDDVGSCVPAEIDAFGY